MYSVSSAGSAPKSTDSVLQSAGSPAGSSVTSDSSYYYSSSSESCPSYSPPQPPWVASVQQLWASVDSALIKKIINAIDNLCLETGPKETALYKGDGMFQNPLPFIVVKSGPANGGQMLFYCDDRPDVDSIGSSKIHRPAYDLLNNRGVAMLTLRYPEPDPLFSSSAEDLKREANLNLTSMKVEVAAMRALQDSLPQTLTVHSEYLPKHVPLEGEVQPFFITDDYDYSLHSGIYDDRLSHPQKLSILQQAARVITAIHKEDYLHCDIKPENIVYREVDDQVEAAVIDFAMAVPLLEKDSVRVNSGTPDYWSPDLKRTFKATKQSDWWAFGATMFYVATGTLQRDRPDTLSQDFTSEQQYLVELADQVMSGDIEGDDLVDALAELLASPESQPLRESSGNLP